MTVKYLLIINNISSFVCDQYILKFNNTMLNCFREGYHVVMNHDRRITSPYLPVFFPFLRNPFRTASSFCKVLPDSEFILFIYFWRISADWYSDSGPECCILPSTGWSEEQEYIQHHSLTVCCQHSVSCCNAGFWAENMHKKIYKVLFEGVIKQIIHQRKQHPDPRC